jgi:GNAT superfamily N-acetyltransferase
MHARCDRETRYSRWLAPLAGFPSSYLHSVLACAEDHLAVVAVAVPDCEPRAVVGLASAAQTFNGWRELGFLVEDRYQAQGVGRMMLASLLELLDPNDALCAYALGENRWLLDKLVALGAVRISSEAGVIFALVDRKVSGNEVRVRNIRGLDHDNRSAAFRALHSRRVPDSRVERGPLG